MDTVVDPMIVESSESVSRSHEGRIAYIDTLRGLASIQVLLSHGMLAFFLGVALASPASKTLVGYLAATPLFFMIDGASAVCIFFVLSGYVLTPVFAHSRATNGAMIGSRFLRLAIPALAGCIFSAILFQIFGSYHGPAGVISRSPWLSDGWRPAANLWFLKDALVNGIVLGFQDSSIAQWFGFPVAALAPMSDSYVTPLWTLSIEFYGSILVLLMARSRSWTLLILATLVLSRTYLLCFLVGHVAARFGLADRKPLAPWPVATAAAVIGLAICLVSHFWRPQPIVHACALSFQLLPPCPLGKPEYLMRVYGASLLTVGVMQCTPIRMLLSHDRLRVLGRLSFPIYLTHWPIVFGLGGFTVVALTPLAGPMRARIAAFLISIFVTVFLAAAFFEPVDQIALRVSRAWRKRKILEA